MVLISKVLGLQSLCNFQPARLHSKNFQPRRKKPGLYIGYSDTEKKDLVYRTANTFIIHRCVAKLTQLG